MMIIIDDSSIGSEQSVWLIDDARGVIYDHRMFIIQATGRQSCPEKNGLARKMDLTNFQ
jgi:hypothetical protein